jgi:hypothetical protein
MQLRTGARAVSTPRTAPVTQPSLDVLGAAAHLRVTLAQHRSRQSTPQEDTIKPVPVTSAAASDDLPLSKPATKRSFIFDQPSESSMKNSAIGDASNLSSEKGESCEVCEESPGTSWCGSCVMLLCVGACTN